MTSFDLESVRKLLNVSHLSLQSEASGGNSKVYCVTDGVTKWAVKSYPPYAPNARDRLAAEYAIYQFLNAHHVPHVPTLIGTCFEKRLLVLSWIVGQIPSQYGEVEIDQAIRFLGHIVALNTAPNAQSLPLAAESCLSLEEILAQITRRYERLERVAHAGLQTFLSDVFLPCFERYAKIARDGYLAAHLAPSETLALPYRSLIPSDFGFHNSLQTAQGELYFFDFDYFGWDDPVKLLADILWHPKMSLSPSQRVRFIHGVSQLYAADPFFLVRFRYTEPLFGLRWSLILLNEFIPAFWQNRQHAAVFADWEAAKETQLVRAKALLSRIGVLGESARTAIS